jgi:hypothetical protein
LYGRQQFVGNRPLIKRRGLQGTLLSAETRRLLATSPDAALRPGVDVVAACSTDTTNVAARSPRQTTARLVEITGRIVPPSIDGGDVTDDD